MKPVFSFLTIKNTPHLGLRLTLTPLLLVVGASLAYSQSVRAPAQPDLEGQPLTIQQPSQLLATNKDAAPVPTFLLWGPVTAHPRASYEFVSTTGVQYLPGHAADTVIQTLSPGILLDLGAHWSLDYQASWNVYSSRLFKDTLDHALSLLGSSTYENWSFNFSQGFSRSSEPLVQTGRQTQQDQYATGFTVRDQLDRDLALETIARQTLIYTTDFNDTKEWSVLEWLHFQVSPRLDTAVGIGPGYVEVNHGSDMNYYKLLGQIDWQPGTKLNLHLDGGWDHRRMRTAAAHYIDSPIANASLNYKLFEHTTVTVGAARTVTASYFSNEVQKNIGWNAGLEQRLLGQLNLSLSTGYQKSTYDQTDPTIIITDARDDNTRWYDARLGTSILKRGTVSLFYRYSKNTSSLPGYGFSSDQYGVDLGYRY